MYFCDDKRGEVKAAHPDMKITDMSKELGAMWKVGRVAKGLPACAARYCEPLPH